MPHRRLAPAVAVVVASVRALKMHGGAAKADLAREDLAALRRGLPNLHRHVENMRRFGLPVVVAINRFPTDTAAEHALVQEAAAGWDTEAIPCTHWADGPAGPWRWPTGSGARSPKAGARFGSRSIPTPCRWRRRSARWRGADLPRRRGVLRAGVERGLAQLEAEGFGHLPVCIAKTPYSFSADPSPSWGAGGA